jgi:hypothetical protein
MPTTHELGCFIGHDGVCGWNNDGFGAGAPVCPYPEASKTQTSKEKITIAFSI